MMSVNRCIVYDQDIDIDVDKLVDLVKERPVIWDKSVNGYRNKDVLTLEWDEIYKALYDNYDEWSEEQKLLVGRVVKQKWTNVRDAWQKTYKKRKEAMEKGENISEFKDSARYEKLKFLTKIYEKYNHFQSNNDKKLVMNLEDMQAPPSPPAEPEDDNLCLDTLFQNYLLQNLMNKNPQVSINLPTKNGGLATVQLTNEQRAGVVNDEHRVKVGSLVKASKRKSSYNHSKKSAKIKKFRSSSHGKTKNSRREEKLYCPNKQSKHSNYNSNRISTNDRTETDIISESPSSLHVENGSPEREDISYVPDNQANDSSSSPIYQTMSSPMQSAINQAENTLQLIKQEELSNPGVSNHNTTTVCENAAIVTTEQSQNTKLKKLIEMLKSHMEDLDKPQMMQFSLEILEPLINDFDKHQLLDFQIVALQLIRKIVGNRTT